MSSFKACLVALAFGASWTFAQGVPSCVADCVQSSSTAVGCTGPMDTTDCICTSQTFLSSVAQCMSISCDPVDLATGQIFIAGTCAVVSSASVTLTSSSTSSTATSSDTTTASIPTSTTTTSISATVTSLSITTPVASTVTITQTVVSAPLPSVVTVTGPSSDTSPFFLSQTSTTTVTQTGGPAGSGAASKSQRLFDTDSLMGGILAPVLLPILGIIGGAFLL